MRRLLSIWGCGLVVGLAFSGPSLASDAYVQVSVEQPTAQAGEYDFDWKGAYSNPDPNLAYRESANVGYGVQSMARAEIQGTGLPKLGAYGNEGGGGRALYVDKLRVSFPSGYSGTKTLSFNFRLSGKTTVFWPVWTVYFSRPDLGSWSENFLTVARTRVSLQGYDQPSVFDVMLMTNPYVAQKASFAVSPSTNVPLATLPTVVKRNMASTWGFAEATFRDYPISLRIKDIPEGEHVYSVQLGVETGVDVTPNPYVIKDVVPHLGVGPTSDMFTTLVFDETFPLGLVDTNNSVIPLPNGSSFQLGQGTPFLEITGYSPDTGYSTRVVPEPVGAGLFLFGIAALAPRRVGRRMLAR